MMSGSFCLVLHGHLPWVLHHGRWPHGEDWLFEAVSETWLPLLLVIDEAISEGLELGWTIGLTPILLEQLAHERFKVGFVSWLSERVLDAKRDCSQFEKQGDERAPLAQRWADRYEAMLHQFEELERDLIGRFRSLAEQKQIALLSSNATHGYMPLLLHDRCASAQLRGGLATSKRHLGAAVCEGIWLPECAYRPPGAWTPPALHGDERLRLGVAEILSDEGVGFCFVDTHLVRGSVPASVIDDEVCKPVFPDQADWDHLRGWRNELEPVRVAERGRTTSLTVLARCPDVSEQVWSGIVGYPGDGRYLEFHKREGQQGLKYWRVTGRDVDLGNKSLYDPKAAGDAVHSNGQHFANTVRERLAMHFNRTGRNGVVTAPFDAELFGHWWHEGPQFLLEVARAMNHMGIECATVPEALEAHPADKAVVLPEGSWGAGGDHRVWQNPELRFYWEILYRAEDRFLSLLHDTRCEGPAVPWLEEAGRQLLLLQGSDWPFVISTGGAVDYGLRRILGHAEKFDDLCNGALDAHRGLAEDPVTVSTLTRCRLVDDVFADLTLDWWRA